MRIPILNIIFNLTIILICLSLSGTSFGQLLEGLYPDYSEDAGPTIHLISHDNGNFMSTEPNPYSVTVDVTNINPFDSRYEFYVNGKEISKSRFRYLAAGDFYRASVQVHNVPTNSGDWPSGFSLNYPRFQDDFFTSINDEDFEYFVDRVRPLIAEIVDSGEVNNINSFISRDIITQVDPRTPQGGEHSVNWKTGFTTSQNTLGVQLGSNFIERKLSQIGLDNFPHSSLVHPQITLDQGLNFAGATSVGERVCIKWNSLSEETKNELNETLLRAKSIAASTSAATGVRINTANRKFKACVRVDNYELDSIDYKDPSDYQINADNSRLALNLNFHDIEVEALVSTKIQVVHRTVTPVRANYNGLLGGSGSYNDCRVQTNVDIDYNLKRQNLLNSRENSYFQQRRALSASNSDVAFDSTNGICTEEEVFEIIENSILNRAEQEVVDLYSRSLDVGYPRNHLAKSMNEAFYAMDLGQLVAETRGLRELNISTTYFPSCDEVDCTTGYYGVYALYDDRSRNPNAYYPTFLSWNGELEDFTLVNDNLNPSKYVITGVVDGERTYGAEVESSLTMTTTPLNRLFWSHMNNFDLILDGDIDTYEVDNILEDLSLDELNSEDININVTLILPPFVSPEWHFQIGQMEISITRELPLGSEQEIAKSYVKFVDLEHFVLSLGSDDSFSSPSMDNIYIDHFVEYDRTNSLTKGRLGNAFNDIIKSHVRQQVTLSLEEFSFPGFSSGPGNTGFSLNPNLGTVIIKTNKANYNLEF